MTDPVTATQLLLILTPVFSLQVTHIYFAIKQVKETARLREDFTEVRTIQRSCPSCPKV